MEIKFELKCTRLILTVAFFLNLACAEVSAQNYFPVEPEKEWVYIYNGPYNPSGEAKSTVTISAEKVKRGEEMYYEMNSVFQSTGSSEPGLSQTFVRKAEDGSVYGINPTVAEDEYLFFPGSPEEGKVWTGLSGKSEIVSTNERIETPGGQFENCVVVESSAGEVKAYSYYQEGKGLVAMKLGDMLMMYLEE
jgi:hypothetical protein